MARRVFFSFHFERDVWRCSQVRNSWLIRGKEASGFLDSASWEAVKKGGDAAIKRWIDSQLNGTSVTAVLIGAETNSRKYVDYEIEQSYKRGNGMLAIHISGLKNVLGSTDQRGINPFDRWNVTVNGIRRYFSELYATYDWVRDSGYTNLGNWVEAAAKAAGR